MPRTIQADSPWRLRLGARGPAPSGLASGGKRPGTDTGTVPVTGTTPTTRSAQRTSDAASKKIDTGWSRSADDCTGIRVRILTTDAVH